MDRSTAKKEYKQAKRPMGVYRIRNRRDGKSYVGFATDIQARLNRHKAELRFGSHRNRELQEEWNAQGESSFQFEVLDELAPKEDSEGSRVDELRVLAAMWIARLEKTETSVVAL